MPFSIVRDDISRVSADIIVNAANEDLLEGGGVCGAIFAGAGRREMRDACAAIGHCPTGSAVVTPGFALDCRWVAHVVGPVWRGGTAGEEDLLRSCYRSLFVLVERLEARSVAFPLVSAGIYGYPVGRALAVAREESSSFLEGHPDTEVTLVAFSRDVVAAGSDLVEEVREFIDDVYVEESPFARRGMLDGILGHFHMEAAPASGSAPDSQPLAVPDSLDTVVAASSDDLESLLDSLDASFSETLLALIDERGMTDAEVYKRANISRQLFSKIRSNPGYRPTKPTAVALALALELDLPQTQDLLSRAGLTLSHASKFDVIVEYCITRGTYDVMRINEVLFSFDQQLLGSA